MLPQGSDAPGADAEHPAMEVVMNGTLVSENCGLVVAINATFVRLEQYYAKAVNYSFMITIV